MGKRRRDSRLAALAAALAVLPGLGGATGAQRSAPDAGDAPAVRIEILKSERTLILYSGDDVVERYPIGLGPNPVGDKFREGDGGTPEGSYSICVKNPHSRYHVSVGLDYPGAADADRGLEAGRIDESEHRRITRALARGTCPPWNTALGGEIFIHGRGSGSDWTLGCVALDDPEMERLYEAVRVGTPVTIKP